MAKCDTMRKRLVLLKCYLYWPLAVLQQLKISLLPEDVEQKHRSSDPKTKEIQGYTGGQSPFQKDFH